MLVMFIYKIKFAVALFICLIFSMQVMAKDFETIYITDKSQYEYAEFLKSSGNYKKASKEFSRLIVSYPESKIVPKAHFSLAETLFKNEDYVKAYRGFQDFVSSYRESRDSLNKSLVQKSEEYVIEIKSILKNKSAERSRRKRAIISYEEAPRPSGRVDRLKAVQILVFEGKTIGELNEELEDLKRSGVNTVIVRVFNNLGDRYHPFAVSEEKVGVYFKTSHVPVVKDILEQVITLSHRKGMKLFAWMTTRYANYGIEDDKEMSCKGYNIQEGRLESCKGLDIFHEDSIRHLEGIYSDLAEYNIDGILFQDDLVLKHNEGFGRYASKLFSIERGKKISAGSFYSIDGSGKIAYTPLFWEWVEWKNKRLISIATRLKDVVTDRRPNVKFAINLMYEAVTNPVYALAWLSQDLEKANDAGFDYFAIMAYHRQMSRELDKTSDEIKKIIKNMVVEAHDIVGDENKLLFKVQTIDWDTGEKLGQREVREIIEVIKEAGNVSLALVPHRMDFSKGVLHNLLAKKK